MHLDMARRLAAYINDNSDRLTATVLEFAHQGWVIIRDNKVSHTQVYVEPIVDVADYLVRAERRSPRLDDEYHNLLMNWLEMHPEQNNTAREPAPDHLPVSLHFSNKFRF